MDTSVSGEDAKKAAAAFASGAKIATAAVADASGTQQLEVRSAGKDKDKTYYAKSTAVEGVYKVTADLGDELNKKVDDFRNRKLFDFGWTDPDKLQVNKAAYDKVGDKWMNSSKQMDPSSVQSVIDKVRDLTALRFADSGGGGPPVLEVMVSSSAGKRIEKATITKQGDAYFAKRENEPSIYVMDSKAVEDLQKAANEVKEFQPPKKK
jgi:hypothetical protein